MDHTFKRGKYTVSVAITLIFFSIVVASYVDSVTCPMILELATEGGLATSILNASKGGPNSIDIGVGQSHLMSKFLRLPKSVFDSSYSYFPCNVTDLLLQIYAVWFIVFMLHKWIVYKKEGWHYFMLDYCYFHNLLMIFLLLSGIVSIEVQHEDGRVRNHRYGGRSIFAPDVAPSGVSATGGGEGHPLHGYINPADPSTFPSYWQVIAGIVYDGSESTLTLGAARYYIGDPARAIIPSTVHHALRLIEGKATSATNVIPQSSLLAHRLDAFLAPFSSAPNTFASSLPTPTEDVATVGTRAVTFIPTVRFRLAPARYALSSMSILSQMRFIVIFIMFLGGTFGPILGAIVIWHNALLFHSFDKMTACYLHLAPALVQIVIMSAVYETSDMVKHLQAVFAQVTEGLEPNKVPPMPPIMTQHQPPDATTSSFRPTDTMGIFAHYMTIENLLLSHVAFFLFWQVFYHVTFGLMALRRERAFAKRMKKLGKLRGFGDCGTNPTSRVTAYTWMMASPPGGKNGWRFKMVCMFGDGPTPTKIMFSVMQLGFHLVYISASLPALYFALKWREEPSWLLLYLSLFALFAIWNAGTVMYKWIHKLQTAADAKTVKAMEIAEQNKEGEADSPTDSTTTTGSSTGPAAKGAAAKGHATKEPAEPATTKRKGGKGAR